MKITAKKYEGDDMYSWAVFIDGRPTFTGMSMHEARSRKASLEADKIPEHKRCVLAAILARSNMGQPLPSSEAVKQLMASTHRPITLEGAVEFFCSDFMENDKHFEIFMDEAKMWYKQSQFNWELDKHPKIKELFV